MSLLVWLAVAVAAPADVQRTHEIEWSRGTPLSLATELPGADPDGRAAIARALGRLRDPGALELLIGLRSDPEERVRVAAAEALGSTPGAVQAIREWLGIPSAPSTLYGRARSAHGEPVALLGALGHQGGAAEIPLLRQALSEPWPIGGAAARALGRMAIRKIPEAREAIPDLCSRLGASDPRTAADAAWALSRLGLEGASAADLERVVRRLSDGGTYETTRAWLIKASWPRLDDPLRDRLFVEGMSDPSRLVRVATLDALQREDVSAEVLSTWLVDPDPWIRLAAISALGREGSEEAIRYLEAHDPGPYERAAAIRASGRPVPVDPGAEPIVRAARLRTLGDPAAWEAAALEDPSPIVRTAGAEALLEREDTPPEVGERLLSARDPAIREAAIELVGRADLPRRIKILQGHLRTEGDADVLGAGLLALASVAGPKDPELDALLSRAGARPEPRVRSAASALAAAAGRTLPPLPPSPGDRPRLADVARIRGARVETSEGSFRIALDPDRAPLAVANFASLAEAGFFDGMVWHRVIPGFVAQTGCPRGDGWGGPGYTLPDEISSVAYDAGSVGMARADRDTGGSQWFVTTGPQPHLAGEYTRFGEVVEGMYVVKRLVPGSRLSRVTIERIE